MAPLADRFVEHRPHRLTVCLTLDEMAEVKAMATRERLSVSAVLRVAVRDAVGKAPARKANVNTFDEGYDHALQQELMLLNLVGTEQAIKLLEALNPYGAQAADEVLVPAAQAAQRRIARGIPDALGGRTYDGQ